MVAIGSAYDTRADAKVYSLTLLEIATRLLLGREKIRKASTLPDMQTTFLLEVLGRYRSRRPESEISGRFRVLYSVLNSIRPELSQNPLTLLRNKQQSAKSDSVTNAYDKWVNQETKRRMLQACLTFDTEQHLLFGQKRALVPHNLPRLDLANLKTTSLLPCEDELWSASPVEKWESTAAATINTKEASTPRSVPEEAMHVDIFRARFLLSHTLTAAPSSTTEFQPFDQLHGILHQQQRFVADFTYHSLTFARLTPIRTLLTVAGESWVLGRKVENEVEFQNAKITLRRWIETAQQSTDALWHATQLLRLLIEPQDLSVGERPTLLRFQSTYVLHEEWTLYLATLICWAHAQVASNSFAERHSSILASPRSEAVSHASSGSSSISTHDPPTLMDPNEADSELRDYLHITNMSQPSDLRSLHPRLLSRTHGLMEVIRTRRLGGSLGGLLNEAERVLYRLVEGRSRISNF